MRALRKRPASAEGLYRPFSLACAVGSIASIPILGNFFKSKNINHSTSELLVLVTPEIVDPAKETFKEPSLAVKMLDRTNFDDKMQKSKH